MRDLLAKCCRRLDRKEYNCTSIDQNLPSRPPPRVTSTDGQPHAPLLSVRPFEKGHLLQMWLGHLQRTRLSIPSWHEAAGYSACCYAQSRRLLLRPAMSHAIHQTWPRSEIESCVRAASVLMTAPHASLRRLSRPR